MILAFGCSVAHGAETVTMGNSEDNIQFSYPALIAKSLGVECINWAFCGNSNENIFHDAIENIPQHNNITAVVVGWTSAVREVWQANDRIWQFIPSWCQTNHNLLTPVQYIKDPPAWSDATPRMCSDKQEYLETLEKIYNILIRYKFDPTEYKKKRKHYILALRIFCKAKNIKLIETCWSDPIDGVPLHIGKISNWVSECRHPSKAEHKLIADLIMEQYKL